MITVHCNMTTWVGTAACGSHHYGSLRCGKHERVDVVHPLSREEVDRLNKYNDGSKYVVGEESGRFYDEETMKVWAVRTCKKHFPDADILVYGDRAVVEPQPILFGPNDLMQEVNKMYARGEEIGFYDSDQGKKNEWDEIVDCWSEKYSYWRL